MRSVQPFPAAELALAALQTSLPALPAAYGIVPSWWNGGGDAAQANANLPASVFTGASDAVPEVELELWAEGSVNLTAAILAAAQQRPLAIFADKTLTAFPSAGVKASLDLATKTTNCDVVVQSPTAGLGGDATTIAFVADAGAKAGSLTDVAGVVTFHFKDGVSQNSDFTALLPSVDLAVKTAGTPATVLHATVDEFTATHLAGGETGSSIEIAGHGLLTGDGPTQVISTGALPAGIVALTNYYVVKLGANDLQLAPTLADALKGTNLVAFTDAGIGTIKLHAVTGLSRVRWFLANQLGLAGDGAIALTSQQAYACILPHFSRTVAYAVVATLDGAVQVSASVWPRRDRG